MAPKQATLGKFFGQPNGAKAPPPQQSKLAFSTKIKKESVKEEEPRSTNLKQEDGLESVQAIKEEQDAEDGSDEKETERNGDVDMSESTDEPAEAVASSDGEGLESEAAVKSEKGTSSKKRSAGGSERKLGSDDDEAPPVKRQRNAQTASKPNATESKTSAREKVNGSVKTSVGKSQPTKAAKSSLGVANTQSRSIHTGGVATKQVNSKVVKKAKESTQEAEESAGEEDAVEDEDLDEKPAVAAKARAKVQATLTSTSKDAYPDWKEGDPVPFAALCTTFSKIEMTTKRLEIAAHCSLFLRQVLRLTPKDLLPTILLMINKLAADYAGIELGIGESLIMKAIGESTGRNLAQIKADQKDIGDLGLVAVKSRASQRAMFKPKPLTICGVREGLMGIATVEGQGAQARKVAGIQKLLSAADLDLAGKGVDINKNKGGPSEAKYIVRMLEGKLRLGLAEKTVLVALAQAMVFHNVSQKGSKAPSSEQMESGERILKSVYSELPSYEIIVPPMLEHGIYKLKEYVKLQPGIPLKPMLAKPTKSITEVLDRFEGKHFSCEYKYDGERAQIHFVAHGTDQEFMTTVPSAGKTEKGISNIFSRNSEDLSKKYPDILAKLPTWVKDGTKSFVLDCETVAWDVNEKKVLPFQQLMTRKRKDVKVEDVKVKVCVFAFDILFLNGEALVNKPFRERREKLHEAFTEIEGEFAFAKFGNTDQLEEIQILLEDSVKASCEGLMVKMLDGPESHYEPSRRSQNWLKVKKDYLAGVGDSLDLVVLGAYFGKGKRTSVYGAFLLACWNPASETYESVCNIGTGFSEAMLEELHKELSQHVIERPKPFYSHSTSTKDHPDVWFEPKFVWEVKTADLTLSPRYKAAANELAGNGGKGVSLRFPRFIQRREDKKSDMATTARQVAEMYQKQESVSKSKGPAVDDDFEY